MRYYSLLAAIFVAFFTGTWLGHTLAQRHQTGVAPGDALATTPSYSRTAEKDPQYNDTQPLDSLTAKMDVVHSELRAVKAELDKLSSSLHTYTASSGNANTGDSISQTSYTPNEIAGFQNNIFAQAADPGFNLNKLHAMPEFQKLSAEDKATVLEEIARRLDSGEISKTAFLPGYRADSK